MQQFGNKKLSTLSLLVSILIFSECQKLLIVLTFSNTHFDNYLPPPTSLLLQRPKVTIFTGSSSHLNKRSKSETRRYQTTTIGNAKAFHILFTLKPNFLFLAKCFFNILPDFSDFCRSFTAQLKSITQICTNFRLVCQNFSKVFCALETCQCWQLWLKFSRCTSFTFPCSAPNCLNLVLAEQQDCVLSHTIFFS